MKKRFIIALFCMSTFFAFNTSKSAFGQYYDNTQTTGFFGNFSINANIGVALPFADISQDFNPYQEDWKMGYGLILRKQFSPIFGIGAQFLNGDLRGTSLKLERDPVPNLYFNSEFMEVNFHAIINFSNLLWGYNEERSINLYSTIGIGFANWATILRDLDNNTEIDRSGYDINGVKAWTPTLSIPVGLGVYFAMGKKWGFNIETSLHRLNSDELDAYISGKSKQDYYAYISAGLTYNLGGGINNVFRRAGKEETNYDKETRKLEKYQERQAKKNRRDQDREEMENERKTSIEKAKRSRRNPMEGMPKVVEYDAVYSRASVQNINEQGLSKFGDTTEEVVKGEKELVFDEGKHFITGVGQTNPEQLTGSANIISARDALKLKSDTRENLSITDEMGSTSTIINGYVLSIPKNGLVYTVQILATRIPANNLNVYRERYGIHQPIYYTLQNGLYRYSAGIFTNYYDAQTYANIIKRNGLGDAFVSTYNNGLRVIK